MNDEGRKMFGDELDEVEELPWATLRGVEAVFVHVVPVCVELEQDGLSTSAIQREAEDRLQLDGIQIATNEERLKAPGSPFLHLKVGAVRLKNKMGEPFGDFVYAKVSFYQKVRLVRDLSIIEKLAATWVSGGVVSGTPSRPSVDNILKAVRDRVDEFANAYLAANPKK